MVSTAYNLYNHLLQVSGCGEMPKQVRHDINDMVLEGSVGRAKPAPCSPFTLNIKVSCHAELVSASKSIFVRQD